MSWEDRIRPGAYVSPSGVRHAFGFESVSRTTPLRKTAFDFGGVQNSYIQENGIGSRTYPLTCYFSGPDCDLEATAFEVSLQESGLGLLEHPLYGPIDVVPFGTITRTDDLKSAANQSVVEVTFLTTTGAVYPGSQGNPGNEVSGSLAAFQSASSLELADTTDLTSVAAQASAVGTTRALLDKSKGSLNTIAATSPDVKRAFRDMEQEINLSLPILVADPIALGLELGGLLQIPATAVAPIADRLNAYAALITNILASREGQPAGELVGTPMPRRTVLVANDFHLADLVASSALAGCITAVLETTFSTRPQAIAAAAALFTQFDALVVWREEGFAALSSAEASTSTDLGGAYQALQGAVALTAGYLIELSFSLLPERSIVLDRARTIIDVCAELYGVVDEKLDFLIDTNDLSGSEILELPAGRRIVYYA